MDHSHKLLKQKKIIKKNSQNGKIVYNLENVKVYKKLNKLISISPGINNIIKLKQIIFIKERQKLNSIFEYCE